MAKKVKCTTGDVFGIPVSETEFIFGRVLFDVTKQYIKIVRRKKKEYLIIRDSSIRVC